MNPLKKDQEIIGIFARQVTKAVLIAQKYGKSTRKAIKNCDEYTIDLAIPTKLGVVKLLPVRELLNC